MRVARAEAHRLAEARQKRAAALFDLDGEVARHVVSLDGLEADGRRDQLLEALRGQVRELVVGSPQRERGHALRLRDLVRPM